MVRVLLIEDEEGLGKALEYQLGREGYKVERITDGEVGLARFQVAGADLVLLDLMLPGMPGEQVCREIRRSSDVPIIMLTARDDEVDKVVGLELGADDYMTKPFSSRELLARMRAVLRRSAPTADHPAAVIELHGLRLDLERFEATVDGQAVHLRRKEFDLLEALMGNAGRVMTREELIAEVWGGDYVGDTKTLDVHIKRLRTKCETDPAHPARIITVRGRGYRFEDHPGS